MSDLRALLDRAAGNPPDLPDIDLIRQRGHVLRTRRRIRWGGGVVAAAVLVAGIGVSVGQSDRDRLLVPARPSSSVPARPPVTNACSAVGTTVSGDIAYSLTRPGLTSAVHVMPESGGVGRCLVDTPGADNWPAWSPDGQWVAFVGGDGIRDDVYIVREDGSGLTRVTDSPLGEAGPVWSPDGSRLAYTLGSSSGQPSSIHVVGRDGRSDEVVLRGPDVGVVAVQDWAPDGQTLLFTRDDTPEGGHIALWAMSPDGSEQRLLRAEAGDLGSAARYSPDGIADRLPGRSRRRLHLPQRPACPAADAGHDGLQQGRLAELVTGRHAARPRRRQPRTRGRGRRGRRRVRPADAQHRRHRLPRRLATRQRWLTQHSTPFWTREEDRDDADAPRP